MSATESLHPAKVINQLLCYHDNIEHGKLDEIYEPLIKDKAVKYLRQRYDELIFRLLKERFGIDTTNLEEVRNFVTRKRLVLAWFSGFFPYGYIGVIANNRWLYTFDGKVIGKKGKNFDIKGHKFTFNIYFNE